MQPDAEYYGSQLQSSQSAKGIFMQQTGTLKHDTEAVLADLDPIRHLRNLDFPRRSGTDGEQKAAAYIAQVLKDNGSQPLFTEFQYSKPKIRSRIIPPMVLLTWLVLSLVNIRFWGNNPVVSLAVLGLPLALILGVLNFGRVMSYFSGRRMRDLKKVEKEFDAGRLKPDQVITSCNVTAEIGPEDAAQQILFTAHFDSISSRIPTRVTMISMMLGVIGVMVYSVLYAANTFGEVNFIAANFQAYVMFALVLVLLLGLFFTSRFLKSNDSHGIIDDGTGVAILLELAKFVQAHPIPAHQFIFGFYGAEENGVIGSTYDYIHRAVDKNKLRVISVDMIGEKAPLAYVKRLGLMRKARMEPGFNEQIDSIAKTLDIKIEGKNFPYPGSDFAPFMLDGGCSANWLINRSRLIHSKHDQLGNVDESLVKDALKLMVAYLLQKREPTQKS